MSEDSELPWGKKWQTEGTDFKVSYETALPEPRAYKHNLTCLFWERNAEQHRANEFNVNSFVDLAKCELYKGDEFYFRFTDANTDWILYQDNQ